MKQGRVWQSLLRLAENLDREHIPYAVVGGMALIAHGYERFTSDVDILMTKDSLERFHSDLVGRGYTLAFTGARKAFRDTESGVRIEVLTTGEYPGDGLPKAIAFPDPLHAFTEAEGFRVISLEKLIELKLASGLSAPHRKLRDLADVQDLIGALNLPLELAENLDASVADEYRQIWTLRQSASSDPHEQGI